MKKIYLMMTIALPLAGFGADPVAWYPLNGNANDAIGTLNGTVSGAVLTTDRFDTENSAYYFDGIDDFIETTDVATTSTTAWALMAWVKLSSLSQFGAVVTNGYDNVLDYGTGYSIHVNNGAGTAAGNTLTGAYDGIKWFNSGGTLNLGEERWYHLAFVRNGDETRMYIDGIATPNVSLDGAYTPVGNVRIGAQNGGRYFAGSIDEVKIFDVGLTAAEVLLEYTTSALPVHLVSFSAKAETDGKVKLNWSTTEEIGASHFIVERSADARFFEEIGRVAASGNTQLHRDYVLTDEIPLAGTSYYRLRQVDFDSKEYLYRAVAVRFDAVFSQVVYPNPAVNDIIYLNYSGPPAEITLTDMSGKNVAIETSRSSADLLLVRGKFRLPPGSYLLGTMKKGMMVKHRVVIAEK
jgi:hypothetical protein